MSLPIQSVSQIPAGVRTYRTLRRGLAYLVACKATYRLDERGTGLAPEQERLHPADSFVDASELSALRAASDWAPFKRRADVVLVGSAYSNPNVPVRRMIASVGVGPLDKAIEVRADRIVDRDGEIHDGAAFTRMPIGWDRAAASEVSNPVGRGGSRDMYGKLHLPNLQPIAFDPSGPNWEVPTVGLGPVSPFWPARAGLLSPAYQPRRSADGAGRIERLLETGIPDDFDFSFFQIAPRDQQIDRLHTDSTIVLEHLHPTQERFVARLPGHRARAFVEPAGVEIEMVADTLVIDTDRQIATLTFRGSLFAMDYPQAARVLCGLEVRGRPLTLDQARELAAPARSDTMNLDLSAVGSDARLPFGPAQVGMMPAQVMPAPVMPAAVMPAAVMPAPAMPAPVMPASTPPAAQSQPGEIQWRAPAQTVPTPERASQPSIVLTGVSQAAAPSFMKGDQPTKADEADGSVAHDRSAGEAGVIAASNAAARVDRTEATRTAEPATAPEVKPKPSSMVDLLWFDPALADRIRGYSPWADALKDAPKKREWVTNADAVKAKEQKTDPARPVARAMTRVPPLDLSALGAVVADSVDEDGLLARPLLVLDGELEVTFDPVDVLRASASTARLFASADKRLKEAVDAAVELAEPDRPVTLPILEGALNRLRQAFAQANRSLAPTYLETSVERSLLERRKWAEREVLGGTHLVARAFSASGASAIAYLPVAIRARLPLVPRVRVRMIAEPHLFQEPDSEQIVLLTLALARTAELAR